MTKELTIKEQENILGDLFGFRFHNSGIGRDDKPHWVLFDEEGDEFYGNNENCQFDFSTLQGIFSYAIYTGLKRGEAGIQYELRKLLGI